MIHGLPRPHRDGSEVENNRYCKGSGGRYSELQEPAIDDPGGVARVPSEDGDEGRQSRYSLSKVNIVWSKNYGIKVFSCQKPLFSFGNKNQCRK